MVENVPTSEVPEDDLSGVVDEISAEGVERFGSEGGQVSESNNAPEFTENEANVEVEVEGGQDEYGGHREGEEVGEEDGGLGGADGEVDEEEGLLGSTTPTVYNGKEIGEQLMVRVKEREKGTNKEEVVKAFIGENEALKELVALHGLVEAMLCTVVRNKYKRDAAREEAVERALSANSLSLDEVEEGTEIGTQLTKDFIKVGTEIGSQLTKAFIDASTAEEAVEKWAGEIPAIREVMGDCAWFESFMASLASQLMPKVRLGVQARVIVGAATSMLDLLTDIYVTLMFRKDDEKQGYFQASLASLTVSLGIQLWFIFLQNKGIGWQRVLTEAFPVLIGFKPALDAYRVATGMEKETGQDFDPLTEMTTMKGVEMFAEAIPGVIIQLMAIATTSPDQEVGMLPWLSVAVSAFTTGFVSATISYDWDTEPGNRLLSPELYGYVPAAKFKRVVVFASMLAISAGMLLIRSMSIVLLGLMGKNWALGYVFADVGLFLIIKASRGDFWHWVPSGGHVEIFTSFLNRISVKIITDFTIMIHLRHPQEIGGVCWSFGLALSMVSLPVAINISAWMFGYWEEGERAIGLARNIVWGILPTVLLSLAVFFATIERKYLGTFWSLQTGKGYNQNYFKNGKDDATKAIIFGVSRHYWVGVEGDMKQWVQENWRRWEEEKPKWLTDITKMRIPVTWIPTEEGRKRESQRRESARLSARGERRQSFLESMAGNLSKVVPQEGATQE